ncbi:MAG TPA: hypothetical protein VN669_07325 [Candidatus Acidoferrales bacterium]|nr:hypothetical protein [Candidatus Acidoferrales bacterium]
MKGWVVEKIDFYSSADYNTISVVFADKTSLNLHIEILTPEFEIRADLEGSRDGNFRVIKKWPVIRSKS